MSTPKRLEVYNGKPVVHGLRPDPRAWLGREHQRPEKLIAQGHFAAFDAARSDGAWTSGDWTEALQQQYEPQPTA